MLQRALIVDRGAKDRMALATKPNGLVREARAGEYAAEAVHV